MSFVFLYPTNPTKFVPNTLQAIPRNYILFLAIISKAYLANLLGLDVVCQLLRSGLLHERKAITKSGKRFRLNGLCFPPKSRVARLPFVHGQVLPNWIKALRTEAGWRGLCIPLIYCPILLTKQQEPNP